MDDDQDNLLLLGGGEIDGCGGWEDGWLVKANLQVGHDAVVPHLD